MKEISSVPAVRPLLRIGVIGCGFIFRSIYSPLLQSLGDRVQVAGVCDVQPDSLRQAAEIFPGTRVYTRAEELLEREELDAVLVLTPEVYNAPTAALALEKNLAVYLEKPPAVSHAEWTDLKNKEARSEGWIYTAFNRRHTPFEGWHPPKNLRKVGGLLARRGRVVKTFPFTAVHLIDAAQYFSGASFGELAVAWEQEEKRWRLSGPMTNGAACDLVIVPDGREHAEYLVVEADETWKMVFPNREASHCPEGGLFHGSRFYPIPEDRSPMLEAAGFAPCLRTFLDLVENGDKSDSRHRLASCEGTIRLLEKMLKS
jgi:virulence factor